MCDDDGRAQACAMGSGAECGGGGVWWEVSFGEWDQRRSVEFGAVSECKALLKVFKHQRRCLVSKKQENHLLRTFRPRKFSNDLCVNSTFLKNTPRSFVPPNCFSPHNENVASKPAKPSMDRNPTIANRCNAGDSAFPRSDFSVMCDVSGLVSGNRMIAATALIAAIVPAT